MNIEMFGLHRQASKPDVISALAKILHSPQFAVAGNEKSAACQRDGLRLINFDVKLNPNPSGGAGNDGTGLLIMSTPEIGDRFMRHVQARGLSVLNRRIKFHHSEKPVDKRTLEILRRMPFEDPKIADKRQRRESSLSSCRIRVSKVQFGVAYQRTAPRVFSVEWEKNFVDHGPAFLRVEWGRKLFRIELFSQHAQGREIEHSIVVRFSDIGKMNSSFDMGNPCSSLIMLTSSWSEHLCADILFDLISAPLFEFEVVNRPITGIERADNQKFRERVGSLDVSHAAIAPYAPQLRVVLYEPGALQEFRDVCEMAALRTPSHEIVFAEARSLFSGKELNHILLWLKTLSWQVGFQIEALLRNSLLHTQELKSIRPLVDQIYQTRGSHNTAELLRKYNERLRACQSVKPDCLLHRLSDEFLHRAPELQSTGSHRCHHVTVTPTRLWLEGPYSDQSNSVVRKYEPQYQDNFVRVDFRDEDHLGYRWDRTVDGESFLRTRVGGILREGFDLAGRHFEFLAYSSSALRGHAVWFMLPFEHPTQGQVNAKRVRANLGDFSGVMACPAKYAARMAQAS